VTNRAPDSDGGLFYSGSRGDLGYGISTIGIPPGHLMGRHEEPSLFRLQMSLDEQKHIRLQNVQTLTRDEFAERLGTALETAPDGKLMIFVLATTRTFRPSTSRWHNLPMT
jgi:esterase/lipase superfamily enzyme